jgi:hypothetical protein
MGGGIVAYLQDGFLGFIGSFTLGDPHFEMSKSTELCRSFSWGCYRSSRCWHHLV